MTQEHIMITLEPYRKEFEKQYKALYLTAFPAEERAPWLLLKRRAGQGRAEALAAMDGGSFAGMAYVVISGDTVYLFYLAVEENRRGQGTGGQIISALRERYPDKRIYLAREQLDESAENYPQRESRHRFYLANGFQDWGAQIKEGPVTYDVMGIGKPVTPAEYRRLITGWAGRFAGLFFRAYMVD